MKKTLILTLTLLLSSNLYAQQASVESVEKLLVVMNAEQSITGNFVNVEKMMRNMIAQKMGNHVPSAQEQKEIDHKVSRMMELFKNELNYEKVKPSLTQLYIDIFDQQEIDKLTEFYSGPFGKLIITKMPLILEKTTQIMQTQLQVLAPKIEAIAHEDMSKAKNK